MSRKCEVEDCSNTIWGNNKSGLCDSHFNPLLIRLHHDEGLTLDEVAERVGLSYAAVHRRLVNAGQPPRTYAQARRLATQKRDKIALGALADPAYEARHGIRDQVACRLCGILTKSPLRWHLASHHPDVDTKEYRLRFPGAPLECLQYTFNEIARQVRQGQRENPPTIESLMADRAAAYLTPGELNEARRDPEWTEKHEERNAVICLIEGFKSKRSLHIHVPKVHDITLNEYRVLFPGMPTNSATLNEYNRGRWQAKLELIKRGQRQIGRPRLDAERDRVCELKKWMSWPKLTKQMNRETGTNRGESAYRSLMRGPKNRDRRRRA